VCQIPAHFICSPPYEPGVLSASFIVSGETAPRMRYRAFHSGHTANTVAAISADFRVSHAIEQILLSHCLRGTDTPFGKLRAGSVRCL